MNIKIGYVQSSPQFGEKERNFEEIAGLLNGIKANLIVLPELFATGYAFISMKEIELLAEEKDNSGPTFNFLKDISRKTGAIIVAGFIEKDNSDYYNASMMVYQDKLTGIYRKIQLFNKEKIWFTPGNKPLENYNVNGINIGMMICFDWIFPEVCRTLALKGAQIIAHPSNLVMPYCQRAMVTRCIENRVFAVTANRIGAEKRGSDHFVFTGGSQITSFDGEVLSLAPANKSCVDFIEINPDRSDNKKINEFNDLIKDRRPEFYF
jgi:predicted amidohydrolase